MNAYLAALIHSLLLLLSFFGWGAFVLRLVPKAPRRGIAYRAALGMSLLAAAGGLLNLLHAISKTSNLGILAIGSLFAMFELFRLSPGPAARGKQLFQACSSRPLGILIGLCLLMGFSFKYAANVWAILPLNFHDDYQAYLVFPKKMLETGWLGPEPFSERRIINSFQGHAYLQNLMLTGGGTETAVALERAIANILLSILILEIALREKINLFCFVSLELIAMLYPFQYANTTSMISGIFLFLCLFEAALLDVESKGHAKVLLGTIFPIALLSAGICSLKTTLIPPLGIFLVLYFLTNKNIPRLNNRVRNGAFCLLLISLLLTPWMITSYHDTGTLLFPAFGRGYHATRYGDFQIANGQILNPDLFELLKVMLDFRWVWLTISFGLACLFVRRTNNVTFFLAILFAAVAGGAYLVNTADIWGHRYAFPFFFAAFFFFALHFLSPGRQTQRNIVGRSLIYFVLIGALFFDLKPANFGAWIHLQVAELRRQFSDIQFAIRGKSFASPKKREQYSTLLNAIPENATVMERLDMPFLLDFRKHKIFVADAPGTAGLPPGMPFRKGSEALSRYLLANRIQFLAFSYANSANFDDSFRERVITDRPWGKRQAERIFDFQDNLSLLAKRYRRIYDDGQIYILDLTIPQQRVEQSRP